MPKTITWKAYEHEHGEKDPDWFWALGIVAFSAAVVAILFQNVLFALLIVIAAVTLGLLATQPSRERTFTLTSRGIMIDEALYPYDMLVAFWINDRDTDHPLLIVDAQRFMTPHIISPLDDVDPEAVRAYLLEHLPEEEIHEPLGQKIFEYFGL